MRTRIAATFIALCLGPASAEAATYAIGWTGNGGYSMTGLLHFADALLGTGAIDENAVLDLSITVLLNNVPLGTRSLIADGVGSFGTFNLNFDTTTETFATGGFSTLTSGQLWFTDFNNCDTVGFISGSAAQLVCVNGVQAVSSYLAIGSSSLTATRVSEVPPPATLPLLGAALFGCAALRRRRNP